MNPILHADSYKLSHSAGGMYPDGITGQWAYGEARIHGYNITVFGGQMLAMKLADNPILPADVERAQYFAEKHGEPFNREPWDIIVNEYGGHRPITIRAIPDGEVVPSRVPIYTVESNDERIPMLPSYMETEIQRGFWYPTTVASLDRQAYSQFKAQYQATGADLGLLPFALHDFAGRGVTCGEQAEIGGAAHLVYFLGSDTMEGVEAANYYYKHDMSGFSVPATEHSVQTAWGPDRQKEYLETVIKNHGARNGIVSLVIDGYDTMKCVELLCAPDMVELVKATGAKVVFRPDSDDPFKLVPKILQAQVDAYGYTVTDKGFKTPNHVGLLWGDGIDRDTAVQLLSHIATHGFAANSIVFGSGGALLQKMNRDTFKFAQKLSAIKRDGVWTPCNKVTPGKESKGGRVSTMRYLNGFGQTSYRTYDVDKEKPDWRKNEYDAMEIIYKNGNLLHLTDMAAVRARALADL